MELLFFLFSPARMSLPYSIAKPNQSPSTQPRQQVLIDAGIKSADTVVVGLGGGSELEVDARMLASLMQVGGCGWMGVGLSRRVPFV